MLSPIPPLAPCPFFFTSAALLPPRISDHSGFFFLLLLVLLILSSDWEHTSLSPHFHIVAPPQPPPASH